MLKQLQKLSVFIFLLTGLVYFKSFPSVLWRTIYKPYIGVDYDRTATNHILQKFPSQQTDTQWTDFQINITQSEHIGVYRYIPEDIPPECDFRNKFPSTKVSIIIPFHNEPWSSLLRTVHGVLDRTPKVNIEEVILVDDASTHEHLKSLLEIYVVHLRVVRIERLTSRIGLVGARLLGAKKSKVSKTGIIIFLDAHVEVNHGWLEPLMKVIIENDKTIAIPHIDTIDATTLKYRHWYPEHVGSFSWNLEYIWKINIQVMNKKKPFSTSTMIGCAFAVRKDYFFKLGGFDPGMILWGGENLELSFRTWMCGGSLKIVPCSRVGHLFRQFLPYTLPDRLGGIDSIQNNLKRLANVWMDEFKHIYFEAEKGKNNISNFDNFGPLQTSFKSLSSTNEVKDDILSRRKTLRQHLKCKSFSWYLTNIAKTQVIPYMDSTYQGELRHLSHHKQCVSLKSSYKIQNSELIEVLGSSNVLTLQACELDTPNNYLALSKYGEKLKIGRNNLCVELEEEKLIAVKCEESLTMWTFELMDTTKKDSKQMYYADRDKSAGRFRQKNTCMVLYNNGITPTIGTHACSNSFDINEMWTFQYKFNFN